MLNFELIESIKEVFESSLDVSDGVHFKLFAVVYLLVKPIYAKITPKER